MCDWAQLCVSSCFVSLAFSVMMLDHCTVHVRVNHDGGYHWYHMNDNCAPVVADDMFASADNRVVLSR